MTITDYLINAVLVLLVLRQARERELDRRSIIIPLAILAYVVHLYVHSIPTAGNDLVLIGALATVGLALGLASGLTTHVRAGENGRAMRVTASLGVAGWAESGVDDLASVVARADAALYRAKAAGKNRVEVDLVSFEISPSLAPIRRRRQQA